jgi:predicted deacylase
LDPSKVAELATRLYQFLVGIKSIAGLPPNTPPPRVLSQPSTVEATEAGLFTSLVSVGTSVVKGQQIGRLKSLARGTSSDIVAPTAGLVLSIMIDGPADFDDCVVEIIDESSIGSHVK